MTRGGKVDRGISWPLLFTGLVLAAGAIGLAVGPPPWPWFLHPADVRAAVAVLPGLTVEEAPPPRRGLIVTSLQTGSEAARAGVRVGDDIAALDGQPVGEIDDAVRYLREDSRPTILLQLVSDHHVRNIRLHLAAGGSHGA